MILAQIEGGIVVNAVEVDPERIPDWAADWPELADGADIGWGWDGNAFSAPPAAPAEEVLAEAKSAARVHLSGVTIECLDFGEFIQRYDTSDTLFYLDPPYWGSEGDYGKALFSRQDFQRLADILTGLKGQFLMSINDVPEIRDLFSWARLDEVQTTYTIGGKGATRAAELLIRGGR